MANIDINTGLAIKADVNKLYGDVAGTFAKFKEDRRFNKDAYTDLLEKYAELVADIEKIKDQLNELVSQAQEEKIPDQEEVESIDAMLDLLGAKKQDGSLDFKKLIELQNVMDSEGEQS